MAEKKKTRFDPAVLEHLLAEFGEVDGALLPIIHAVQDRFGYVPPEAVPAIAKFLRATAPQIYAVITYYSEFRTKPRGETVIGVCRGPACRLLGALSLQERLERRLGVRAGETTPDGKVTLETVSCLGVCGLAPAVEVGHETIGRVDETMLDRVAEEAGG